MLNFIQSYIIFQFVTYNIKFFKNSRKTQLPDLMQRNTNLTYNYNKSMKAYKKEMKLLIPFSSPIIVQ